MSAVDVDRVEGRLTTRRPSGEPPPLPKEIDRVAVAWLVEFVSFILLWLWIFLSPAPAIWITELDLDLMRPIVDNRVDWLTSVGRFTNGIALPAVTFLVGWTVVAIGLAAKRIRHVLLFVSSIAICSVFATLVSVEVGRPRPVGFERLGDWEGFSQPSRPITVLTVVLVGAGQVLIPSGRWRRRWHVVCGVVLAWCVWWQVYLAVEHPSDGWASITIGVAVTLLLFRIGAPDQVFPIRYRSGKTAHLDVTGARGEAIRSALRDQLGVEAIDLTPVGLEGSAGSTPLRVRRVDGPDLFAKLYASNHLRSDRSYKLGRTLLYGRLEDEQRFTSVRRLVQHEDYMLRVMRDARVATLRPHGIVEITPDREYLLVTEFLGDATEIGDVEVTDDLIDQGLDAVTAMWQAGLAHRDIKPANVMVQDGELRLIDAGFGEIRPSPWRQAVDLANMMLVLALGSSPERVYERALLRFDAADIGEAFAASRGVTLPSALRAEVRRDGRELLERFRQLAPHHEPVAIQRWSIRRVALIGWVLTVVIVMLIFVSTNLAAIGLWR